MQEYKKYYEMQNKVIQK